MVVRVIRPFKDKHTGAVCQKGQEIDVTQERFEELSSAALGPFVDQVKEPGQKKEGAPKKPVNKRAKK